MTDGANVIKISSMSLDMIKMFFKKKSKSTKLF